MPFCFSKEGHMWSGEGLASGILYKRWTGTQDTAHHAGAAGAAGGFRACGVSFPTSSTGTGLGPAIPWGEKSCLWELGVAEHPWWRQAGREGRSQRKQESCWDQKQAVREPHSEISDLPPSLSYFVNLLCILISGAYKHRHKAVCFSNLKTGNLPPLTFYKWRINGRLFILKFWNSQPRHWWLTNG